MTDDAIIIEALAMRLVEIRPGGEVWRVATRSRTGRVIPLPAAKRADPIDSSTGYRFCGYVEKERAVRRG